MPALQFFLQLYLLGISAAQQAANFNVSNATANTYGCGEECQQNLQWANQIDVSQMGYDFDFDFYSTAANFSGSQPGDVLKFQALDTSPLDIKAGTSVFRIQYTSLTTDNATVPATGFIALPYAPGMTSIAAATSARKPRFPVIAYAHGTCGLYRGCAPSNGPSLFDYDSWQLAVARGYAVVATDYAGLGNNYTTHKYTENPLQVHDVYYSVVAARKLFGADLTDNWVGVGHSQGGGVVWKLAESDYVNCHDGQGCKIGETRNNYLGTVAFAPATRYPGNSSSSSNDTDGGVYVYLPHLAVALQRIIPNNNVSVVRPKLQRRLDLAEKAQLCTTGMAALTFDLSLEDLLPADGIENVVSEWEKLQEQHSPASGGLSYSPVLLMQGLNDSSVQPSMTEQAYAMACGYGNEIHLTMYPGLEHDPIIPASGPEWLTWIDQRFAGYPTSGRCSKRTVQPYDSGFKAPSDDF